MFKIEIKYLFDLLFLGNLTLGIVVLIYYISHGTIANKKQFEWFGLAKFCQAIAYILFYTRNIAPDFLSINLANMIFFTGFYFESMVILSFLNSTVKKDYKRQLIILIVDFILFNIVAISYPRIEISPRVAIATLSIFVLFIGPCLKFLFETKGNLFKLMYSSSYLLVLMMSLYRIGYALYKPSMRDSLTPDNVDQYFYLATCLLMIVSSLGFFLLVKEKQDMQIQELMINKDRFFTIIAHDLRGPLGAAVGLSEMLKQNLNNFTSAEIEDCCNMIYDSSKNTFKLLENLLDWSRLQTNTIEFKPQLLILDNLITETIVMAKSMADNKNIELTFVNQVSSIELLADYNMLQTILRNLISNAIKFTPKKGIITIEAIKNDTQVEVSVRDTGVGMAPVLLNKLFKMSEKVSHRGTEDESGTGLGLLLCSEFITKHGGRIWAESQLGKGSTFKFTLPISKV